MDILQQQYNKNNNKQKSNIQKIVLKLIVFSIIVFIILICALLYLKSKPVKKELSLVIDGKQVQLTPNLVFKNENQKIYLSLKELSELLSYKYNNGEFLNYAENVEDKTKGYIEYLGEVVGFEQNSNKIYKTSETSKTDYEYITLKNEIISNNNLLYISLEDLEVGLELFEDYSETDNTIAVKTLEYASEEYKKAIEEKTKYKLDISKRQNNKSLLQNLFIVSDEKSYGVIDEKLETLIGMKYKSIIYEDYCGDFIAVNVNDKYGVLKKNVDIKIEFEYDGIEILNYDPFLYKVKKNNLYGIVDEKGKEIVKTIYTDFGMPKSTSNNTEATLLISDIEDNDIGLVVNKSGKYGVLNIKTGKEIIPCELSNIYSRYDKTNQEKEYYVEKDGSTYTIKEYIQSINTITVQM